MIGSLVEPGWHQPDQGRGCLSKRSHFRLLLIATLVWAGFWAGGLPSYYQQYSAKFMVIFDLVALVLIAGVVYFVAAQDRAAAPGARTSVDVRRSG